RARHDHRQGLDLRSGDRARSHPLVAHAAALPELSARICRANADFAGYESEPQMLTVYPPHPEEGASTCVCADAIVPWRPSRRMGGPMVRDAAHEAAESG